MFALLSASSVLVAAATASAVVTEPSGLQVPIPEAQSKDYYDATIYNAGTLGLQSMFNAWEGPGVIDIQADAATEPAVFSPLCGLQGSMILRGGSCQVDFGWYCADDPPGAEVIHPLVTGADMAYYHNEVLNDPEIFTGSPLGDGRTWFQTYQNKDEGFVPTIQMGMIQPVQGAQSLADIRNDPAFQACPSGKIGFAFKGNPTSFCPQSKFSEPARNEMSTYGSPWISVLVYSSKKTPGLFYMAFEDMPTRPESFSPMLTTLKQYYPTMAQPEGWDGSNDGDFNDFVFTVSGIVCEGGGQICDTGKPGVCANGVTGCVLEPGQTPTCTQNISESAEVCDNLDNDCNGIIDDGDLCTEGLGWQCYEGTCVPPCGNGEFGCPGGTVCEGDICVKTACVGVACPAGSVCVEGACVGGCDGVVCPTGQECMLGRCVDVCANVECPEGFVCKGGGCIADCRCLPCPAGLECGANGHCSDPRCANVVCEPGFQCDAGVCVDPCLNANCPGGTECVAGNCVPTSGGGQSGTGGTGGIVIGLGGSANGTAVGGTGTGTGSTPGIGAPGANGKGTAEEGCSCRVSDTGSKAGGLLGLLLAAGLLARRRRS